MRKTALTRSGYALGNGIDPAFVTEDHIFGALKDAGHTTANPIQVKVSRFILDDDGAPAISNNSCAQIGIVPSQVRWGNGDTIWIKGIVTEVTGVYPRIALEYDDGGTEKLQIGPVVGDHIFVAVNVGRLIGEVVAFTHGNNDDDDAVSVEMASMAAIIPSFADPESVLEITPPSRPLQF